CIVSASGNGCTSVTSSIVLVTVVADPTITVQPTAITQCIGGTSALSVTATGGTPSLTYQWFSNVSNSNSGGSAITGATSSTYTPSSLVAGTVYYYCVVSASGDGCASATSNAVAVIVQTTPSAGTIGSDQTICSGGDPAAFTNIASATGDGAITYIWQSSLNNSSWSPISSATSATYDPPSNLTTTTYYRRVATSTLNGNTCSVNSDPVLVTVNPIPTVNTISNQVVCVDQQFSAITFSGTVTSTVYNWTNNNTNTGLASSGTGNVAAFTATNLTNAAIVSTVVVTPIYTNNSVSCTGSTKSFTLTVNPKATIANKTVSTCSGTGFTVTPSNGGGDIVPTGTTYAWSALPVVTGGLT
ncbi:MAG: hypothetical protein ACK4X2_00600, partial [Bacteroidota bacterium]